MDKEQLEQLRLKAEQNPELWEKYNKEHAINHYKKRRHNNLFVCKKLTTTDCVVIYYDKMPVYSRHYAWHQGAVYDITDGEKIGKRKQVYRGMRYGAGVPFDVFEEDFHKEVRKELVKWRARRAAEIHYYEKREIGS